VIRIDEAAWPPLLPDEPAMKLNILMPVYNGAEVLDATVQSVLAQTFPDFTFVIVDDGSVDATSARLARYGATDPRLRIVSLGRNGGIIAALNHGLEHLDDDCEYVARIDCGDVCSPDRMAAQVAYLDAHGDCAVLGSRFEMFGADGPLSDGILRFEQFSNGLCTHDEIHANFTVMSPLHHPTLALRREVFSDVGAYDPRCEAAEDYDLIGRILTRGLRVAKLSDVLTRCRFAAGRGISQTNRIQQVKTALDVKLRFVRANHLRDDVVRRCLIWGSREFAGYLAEILADGRHGLVPTAFTGFDPETWGREMSGLRVLAPDEMLARRGPDDVVITMWNRDRDRIMAWLVEHGWTRDRDFFVFS
jgi:glycosyltransferase involved in cell wall biosynthesis